jgi:hypothetical protein
MTKKDRICKFCYWLDKIERPAYQTIECFCVYSPGRLEPNGSRVRETSRCSQWQPDEPEEFEPEIFEKQQYERYVPEEYKRESK